MKYYMLLEVNGVHVQVDVAPIILPILRALAPEKATPEGLLSLYRKTDESTDTPVLPISWTPPPVGE